MGSQLRSTLLAGFVSGFIWMFIANLAEITTPRNTALIGLGFVVVVALVTAVVGSIISKGRT